MRGGGSGECGGSYQLIISVNPVFLILGPMGMCLLRQRVKWSPKGSYCVFPVPGYPAHVDQSFCQLLVFGHSD